MYDFLAYVPENDMCELELLSAEFIVEFSAYCLATELSVEVITILSVEVIILLLWDGSTVTTDSED